MSKSTSETGHAINVANFKTLITYCTGYAERYIPVIEVIKIPQLNEKYALSKRKLNLADAKKSLLNEAVNQRITAFDGLEILCTNVTNAFSVSGAKEADIKDLQAINKKIQGPGKKKKSEENDGIKGISTSQQSFDSKINFFTNFIQFLEAKPFYNPNEAELKIPKLQSKLEDMIAANDKVDIALFNYDKERNSRNDELYNPTTGLVQVSKDVKKYARSILGASSPEFKQLNSLKFEVVRT